MRNIDATAQSGLARKTAESTFHSASVIYHLMMDVRDCYRPKLHYMRGRGPKWPTGHRPFLGFDPTALLLARQQHLSPARACHHDAVNPTR